MGVFELLIGRGGGLQFQQLILADSCIGQLLGAILFILIFIKNSKCLLLKSLQAARANGPPCLSGNLGRGESGLLMGEIHSLSSEIHILH